MASDYCGRCGATKPTYYKKKTNKLTFCASCSNIIDRQIRRWAEGSDLYYHEFAAEIGVPDTIIRNRASRFFRKHPCADA